MAAHIHATLLRRARRRLSKGGAMLREVAEELGLSAALAAAGRSSIRLRCGLVRACIDRSGVGPGKIITRHCHHPPLLQGADQGGAGV